MSLVVEDGTGLADANTYVTLAEVRAFAVARGKTVPADDTLLTVMVIKACDYIETFADRFRGSRLEATALTQALSWPRQCVEMFGYPVANGAIPNQLKAAQMQAVVELIAVPDFLPAITSPQVLRETVGPVTTQYSERNGALSQPYFPFVDALLRPVLNSGGTVAVSRG